MRLLHTSDWHLGRRLGDRSLLDDQRAFCDWLVEVVEAEGVEAVLIAGDLYDRDVPPTEAVGLYRDTLRRLVDAGVSVIAIAGNHDAADRVAAYDGLTDAGGVVVRGGFAAIGGVVRLSGSDGPLAVAPIPYLNPLSTPGAVAEVLAAEHTARGRRGTWRTHDRVLAHAADAARAALIDEPRSVAVAHAFVSRGLEGGSERQLAVGDAGQVRADRFDGFSYVALGHLHRPQTVAGRDDLRYSGAPLSYSFGKGDRVEKEIVIVDVDLEGSVTTQRVPVDVGRRTVVRRGTLEDILSGGSDVDDRTAYVRVELTDAVLPLGPRDRLLARFPQLVEVAHLPTLPTPDGRGARSAAAVRAIHPLEAIDRFWADTSGSSPTDADRTTLESLLIEAWGDEPLPQPVASSETEEPEASIDPTEVDVEADESDKSDEHCPSAGDTDRLFTVRPGEEQTTTRSTRRPAARRRDGDEPARLFEVVS